MRAKKVIRLVLIVATIIGLAWYWNDNQPVEQKFTVIPSNSSQQSLKTYHNEKLGFKFELPTGWELAVRETVNFGSDFSIYGDDFHFYNKEVCLNNLKRKEYEQAR